MHKPFTAKRSLFTTNSHRDSQKLKAWLLILVTYTFAYILYFVLPQPFLQLNFKASDAILSLRNQLGFGPPLTPLIVHIDIDDNTKLSLGVTELSREVYGKTFSILKRCGVKAILCDILFAFPRKENPEDDQRLIEGAKKAEMVYLPLIFGGPDVTKKSLGSSMVREGPPPYRGVGRPDTKIIGRVLNLQFVNFPELSKAVKGFGAINAQPDIDGVYRRTPLLIPGNRGYCPSLALALYLDFQNIPYESVEIRPGKLLVPDSLKKDGKISIPIDAKNNIIINFTRRWGEYQHVSLFDILRIDDDIDYLEILKPILEGRVAILSQTGTGISDLGTTPLEEGVPLSTLHAQVLNSLLMGKFIRNSGIWESILIEGFFLMLVLMISMSRNAVRTLMLGSVILSAYCMAVVSLFLTLGILFNLVRPILSVVAALLLIMSHQYRLEAREKHFLKRTFMSYFPPEVVDKITSSPNFLEMHRGEKKAITVLFSDIVGFSTYCENRSPEQIRSTLNEYFTEMAKIVFRSGGTIDKYIGDGLMVFFNDPIPQPDHARRALETAFEMQSACKKLRKKWIDEDGLALEIRIGINTGEAIVGNLGSDQRLDYTVLGAAVNLAQRLESAAPPGGILVSESVVQESGEGFQFISKDRIKVKGIAKPVEVYLAVHYEGPSQQIDSQ